MTMTQALGALSTPSTPHIRKQDPQDPKAQSFAAISESMRPATAKPDGSDTKSPALHALTASGAGPSVSSPPQPEKASHADEEKSALQQLRDYMELSPAEKIRASMLNEMGLTEEELENLPPDEQQAIELKITQRIEDTLGADATPLASKVGAASSLNLDASNQGMDQAVRLYQAINLASG